jgi:hypothetical protein
MRTSELGRFRSRVAVTGGLVALGVSALCVPHARAILLFAGLAIGLFLVVAVLPILAVALILRAVGRSPSAPTLVVDADGPPRAAASGFARRSGIGGLEPPRPRLVDAPSIPLR